MKSTIKRLEEQLGKVTQTASPQPRPTPSANNIETTTSQLAGTFHINHGSRVDANSQAVSRNLVIHKSRLFGASHWAQGASMVGVHVCPGCVLTLHSFAMSLR